MTTNHASGAGDDMSHDSRGFDNETIATKALMTPDGMCAQHPWVELRKKDLATGQTYQLDSCPECNEQYEANKEALRKKRLELERQLQALENESVDASTSASASAATRSVGSNERESSSGAASASASGTEKTTNRRTSTSSESHSMHPQPYRPPLPLQQTSGSSPGRAMMALDDDDDSTYSGSNPQRQQQHQPFLRPPMGQQRFGGPSRTLSSASVTSHSHSHTTTSTTNQRGGSGADIFASSGVGGNATPFANQYDPQLLAAAAAAIQQQQQFQQQQQQQQQQMNMAASQQQEEYNSAMLWKMLRDKEEELRQVRQTLEETQEQFLEQALLATKLQTTLDQTKEKFEKERLVIRLQAEKEAQKTLISHQEDLFQKQLEWVEKNVVATMVQGNSNSNSEYGGMGDSHSRSAASGNEASLAGARAGDPGAGTGAAETSLSESGGRKKPEKKHPWSGVAKASPGRERARGAAHTDTTVPLKMGAGAGPVAAAATNGKKSLYPPVDESLIRTDTAAAVPMTKQQQQYQQQHQHQHQQVPPNGPPTPLGLSTAETPMANNTTAAKKNNNKTESSSSDRFDPVYVTPSSEDDKGQLSSLDDESMGQTVASSTFGDDRVKVVNKTLLDPYGDKGTYTGVVLRNTGMPHGLGRMVYEEDNRVFEGDWRHGRWHGYGRATFSNGDSYEGEYKYDQRHGTGVYRWNDGRVYDGQFSEDKRHGKGIFTWPDGAVYDGDFVNGQRQGHGKYTFADGGQYEGSWKDGRYDGFGTCTWEDGRRYRGEWRNGMAHGRGTETYPNGNIRHEGEWIDDEPIRASKAV